MKDLKRFNAELKAKNLAGYWETSEGESYREPHTSFAPCLWKWQDIHDAVAEAGTIAGLEQVPRRVIRLCSPDKGTTAQTFQCNFQLRQDFAILHHRSSILELKRNGAKNADH